MALISRRTWGQVPVRELGAQLTVASTPSQLNDYRLDGVTIVDYSGGFGLNSTDPWAFPNRLNGPGCGSDYPGNPSNYIKTNCLGLPMATPAIAAQCTPFGAPAAPKAGTCSNLLGNAGHNTVIGPGLTNLDFSLIKNNHIAGISENSTCNFGLRRSIS
jgi:hypothetical protein